MNILSTLLLFAQCLFFTLSCKTKTQPEPATKPDIIYSEDQERIFNKIDYYKTQHAQVTNQHIKNTIGRASLDSFSNFIADSMKHIIRNARVRMTRVLVMPLNAKHALVAMFEDHAGNEYWMSFHYDKKDSAYKSYHYQFLKNIPKYVDTIVSFLYIRDIKWRWEHNTPGNFKMRIVPFPKNFNFDSAAVANKVKGNK